MDKEFGKARKKIRGNRVCEGDRAQEICDRTHQRSSAQEEVERAYVCAQKRRSITVRSIAARVRTIAPTREAQISRSPILVVFNFRVFCKSLLHKDSNPTIFRVSRILLESINRPVNTEEGDTISGRRIDDFQGANFSGLFFSFIL
jgi:hypothetical protein